MNLRAIRTVAILAACLVALPLWATDFVSEPARQIPGVYDVDVAVPGGGLSGVFAAIAAARNGARVVLIERFDSLGGTAGPGINPGGGEQKPGLEATHAWATRDLTKFRQGTKTGKYLKVWIYPEIAGIPKE